MANLKEICKKIRRQIIHSSYRTGACHLGSSLSCVEILATLYWKILKKNDIFIFSKASGASALYSILAERGYFEKEKLDYYLKNYPLASKEVPGILHSVGSLGHGLPVSVGLALANRKRKVYCLISDAEVQEGTFWESLLFSKHHKLDNLIILIDGNGLQACGWTKEILNLNPLSEKVRTFGCNYAMQSGNECQCVEDALLEPPKNGSPNCIIFGTIKGKGVDFMENNYHWHYRNLSLEDYQKAIKQLQ